MRNKKLIDILKYKNYDNICFFDLYQKNTDHGYNRVRARECLSVPEDV